jgi:hypothetical protein
MLLTKLILETVSTGRVLDPKFYERESTKSSVDDLILGRGDVSFRAAFTLRVTAKCAAESQIENVCFRIIPGDRGIAGSG